jgi:hypothetical protein
MRFVRVPTPSLAPARLGAGQLLACACAAAALGTALASASCSLLVQFDDVAGACDGSDCMDATAPPDVHPGAETGVDAPDAVAADGDAADAGVDHYAPCGNLASGYYCATDGLHGYAGPQNDLVHCVDGGVGQATFCDGGCLPLPAPFPDACNPCVGHPDGLYCGRDLAGFPAINGDFLIQCQTSNVVQSVACAHGCKSSGTASSCFP